MNTITLELSVGFGSLTNRKPTGSPSLAEPVLTPNSWSRDMAYFFLHRSARWVFRLFLPWHWFQVNEDACSSSTQW